MIDDDEAPQENQIISSSIKFPFSPLNHPDIQPNSNILYMSASKKYIYILTDQSKIFCLNSSTLMPTKQSFSIIYNEAPSNFKENITKIWTDREGNHSIIRFKGKIFYLNVNCPTVKELNHFKGIEITAVGFDDNNEDDKKTGNFLATDYSNRIYECSISLNGGNNGEYIIQDNIARVSKLSYKDWDTEEDEDLNEETISVRVKNEKLYGIRFVKTSKNEKEIGLNDNVYYVLATTRTRLYQFIGTGQITFRQMFSQYNENPFLFNESCKYFPQVMRKRAEIQYTDLDILYTKKDSKIIEQFGWKTETGFCFGTYEDYEFLPSELKKFTVVPFTTIDSEGNKEKALDPISVTHTRFHIFTLYKNCLTIISKITSNIVHSQNLESEFKGVIYNEFSSDYATVILYSNNQIYKISLRHENVDIWRDYIEIGDYENATKNQQNKTLQKRINRINADESFENNNFEDSAKIYVNSDEAFENVCLKYIMIGQIEPLSIYLNEYIKLFKSQKELNDKNNNEPKDKNKNEQIDKNKNEQKEKNDEKEKDLNLQGNLIATLLIQLFLIKIKTVPRTKKKLPNKKDIRMSLRKSVRELNKNESEEEEIKIKKKELEDFRQLIREKWKYLKDGNIISGLLLSYGRRDEFVEFTSTMGDFESAILNHINHLEMNVALEKLTWFASFTEDKNIIEKLSNFFLNYCSFFFRSNPKESVSLLKQRFKNINIEPILKALINYTGYLRESKKEESFKAILGYLKYLIDKTKAKQENNIHNLYIYYLSRSKSSQNELISYLKDLIKKDDFSYFHKKKDVLFRIELAKKLFKNNHTAYALILALMGKYSEGVKEALNDKNEKAESVAKFIASNAPGDKLKKKLWIEIFFANNHKEFKDAIKIIEESKILKIEDVLPYITDSIQIDEFKQQIKKCIIDYENNIKKLKEDINDYNTTSENLKNNIKKVKNKPIEIKSKSCKCDICQDYIKDKNVFVFPCGHMLDANCIRKRLLDYEIKGLDYIHSKNLKIDELFYELNYINERLFRKVIKKEDKEEEKEKEKEKEQPERAASFFIFRKDKPKKQEETQNKEEMPIKEEAPIDKKKLKKELNSILSEQCVLCGDYIVDSVQCSICKPRKLDLTDGYRFEIEGYSDWDYKD